MKTPDFKLELFKAGGKSNSEIAYAYIEGAVNPETLAEFQERITPAKEMEILETSYIEELLEDSVYSPLPQSRVTERPDIAVAALLDGKIIVMVSGSPSILICPGLFLEFLMSPEDYYQRTVFSSFIRYLRFMAFFLTVFLPSIYIALTTFDPELIPTVLLLAILNTREGIPFPAFIEALIMVFFFEILVEAGVRLPRPVGSAVSIVGALVIGEASINAGIASPIMVVVVALTGIAKFSLPQYSSSNCCPNPANTHDVPFRFFGGVWADDRDPAAAAAYDEFTFARSALSGPFRTTSPTTIARCVYPGTARFLNIARRETDTSIIGSSR